MLWGGVSQRGPRSCSVVSVLNVDIVLLLVYIKLTCSVVSVLNVDIVGLYVYVYIYIYIYIHPSPGLGHGLAHVLCPLLLVALLPLLLCVL